MQGDHLGVFGFLETDAGILVVSNARRIEGRVQPVWDLPGGRVEPGETLHEALRREMREETGLGVAVGDLLFVGEGERLVEGQRTSVWRSFFFIVERSGGQLTTAGEPEILDARFCPRDELPALLTAPYHAGFRTWLSASGGPLHAFDVWAD